MDGEKKFILVLVTVIALCITIVYTFLFISLWAYKEWVGASLVAVVLTSAGVYMRGRLNEQDLRQVRYKHHDETPIDMRGEPVYWPQGVQRNPHRVPQE